MGSGIVRARATVSGRVQGVWFRQSTFAAMQGVPVAGWVRNLPDGSVEAVFEGERDAVECALDFVRVGPERARVDGIDVVWEAPAGLVGFQVR